MKILFLTTSYPISQGSVSGPFIKQLANNLSRFNELTVLAPAGTVTPDVDCTDNPKLSLFRYAPLKWQILAHAQGGIPETLKRNRYAILLVPFFLLSMFFTSLVLVKGHHLLHANWSICGAIAGIVGRLTRKKVITTFRGSDLERAKTSLVDYVVLRIAIATSDALVTVNTVQRAEIVAIAPHITNKLHTISNGVGRDFYTIGKNRFVSEKALKILTVGRLVCGKEIDTIIRALAITNNKEMSLTIVGEGPERNHLIGLASELGIHERVSFCGNTNHTSMPEVYKNHDVFVLASRAEGRSNALLEAIATCTPVICSDISGNTELIEEKLTGRIFPVGDHILLSHLLNDFSECPLTAQKMAHRARGKMIKQGLSWKRCSINYQDLYQMLLKHR